MNIIRTKIIAFWLSFLLFCFLLWISWHHRLLWIAIFMPAWLIIGLIKPRLPVPPPKIRLLMRLTLFVFVFALVVHGLLFPYSAALYLVVKILLALLVVPVLCYKAYADYIAFRSSHSGSA
ncbi:MAG: hypothetical protein ABSF38_19615 [Verrucomicrobiota bacterium]|jgi:hypothetical protein